MKAGKDFCVVVAGMYAPRLVYYEVRLTPTASSSSDEECAIAIVPPTKGDRSWGFSIYPEEVRRVFEWADTSPDDVVGLLESLAALFDALPDGASTRPIIDAFLASVAML